MWFSSWYRDKKSVSLDLRVGLHDVTRGGGDACDDVTMCALRIRHVTCAAVFGITHVAALQPRGAHYLLGKKKRLRGTACVAARDTVGLQQY